MFTGIISALGTVTSFDRHTGGAKLTIETGSWSDLRRGESVATSGVCLTVFPEEKGFSADLSDETLSRTNLGMLQPGSMVNLERAMTLQDRLGGHLVQGHVDSVGSLVDMQDRGEFAVWRWQYDRSYAPLVVEKGSIALDGISLTIVEPTDDSFAVALIPETLRKTNLQSSKIGDRFNLEFDVMAKYVQRLMEAYLPRERR